MKPSKFAALATLLFAAGLNAQVTEPKTGKTFDEKIKMPMAQDVTLRCAGAGVRTKFVVKVYAGALYLDEAGAGQALSSFKGSTLQAAQGSAAFHGAIVKASIPKAIVMKFARAVGKDKIVEAYTEGLESSLGSISGSPLKAEAQKFLAMFNEDIGDSEEIAIYAKGSLLNVFVRGKEKGTIDSAPFAEAVFKIWLGDKPVSADLKKSLVSHVEWALK